MDDFEQLLIGGRSTTTTASTSPIRTTSEILADMERAIKACLRMASVARILVRDSPMATQTVPSRVHKKRRNQSDTYDRRIQKKWTKRWGTKEVPAAYIADNSVLGGYGKTLIVHPVIMARLRSNRAV